MVSDYSGLSFNEVMELDAYTYRLLLRDGYVHQLAQSEAGQKHLEECWLLTCTEPDMDGLNSIWGIKKEGGTDGT